MNIAKNIFDSGFKTFRGYTLLTPVEGKKVFLIDMKGEVVHSWQIPLELGAHAILLPDCHLLCAGKVSGPLAGFDGAAGRLMEMDWDGNIVWQYEDAFMHHDFWRLPNGNTLYLRWVPTPKEIAGNVRGGLPGTEKDGVMWSDAIREISHDGQVVWEWLAYEHLDPSVDIVCPLCHRTEWTHANAFDVGPEGNILVSLMKTNNIILVNKKTGKIDWQWGGFLTLAHPHDIAWLDNENIMVLGCGGHIAATEVGECEILWINLKTKNIVWEFKETNTCDFYSPCKASFQRLPNANTLICEGDTGRVFEVMDNRETIWEFINPFYQTSKVYGNNNMLFRAYRYGLDYVGLKGNPRRDEVQSAKVEQATQDRFGSRGSLC